MRYEGTASYPEVYNTGNGFHGGAGYQNGGYNAPSNQYGAPFAGNVYATLAVLDITTFVNYMKIH